MDDIAAQRQFLVKVDGIEEYFMTKSGGAITSDSSKMYDGGKTQPSVIASPAQSEDVTVSRGFKPLRDGPVLRQLRGRVGRYRSTVSVTPTDADLVPVDEPVVYPDALLVGLTDPEADANSGDGATLELVFAISKWT